MKPMNLNFKYRLTVERGPRWHPESRNPTWNVQPPESGLEETGKFLEKWSVTEGIETLVCNGGGGMSLEGSRAFVWHKRVDIESWQVRRGDFLESGGTRTNQVKWNEKTVSFFVHPPNPIVTKIHNGRDSIEYCYRQHLFFSLLNSLQSIYSFSSSVCRIFYSRVEGMAPFVGRPSPEQQLRTLQEETGSLQAIARQGWEETAGLAESVTNEEKDFQKVLTDCVA